MRRRRNIKLSKPAAYGPLATIKEWMWCLASAKHAEGTWLRIEPEKERRAFRVIERFLYAMAGAIIATSFLAYRQYMFTKDMEVIEYSNATYYIKPKPSNQNAQD